MMGVVVAAHGSLAEALVSTARLVVPGELAVQAVGIFSNDDAASFEQQLRRAIQAVRGDHGVLVLTDMFGGSPSNVGLMLHEPERVEIITGANLPMVIRALQLASRNRPVVEAAREVRDYGQRAISVATDLLGGSRSVGVTQP